MAWTPLASRLNDLPLILAGPILRRTEPERVTVWVALKAAASVTVQIYRTRTSEGDASVDNTLLLKGTRKTVALGQHLHVAAVTATPAPRVRSADPEPRLKAGEIYAYNLLFDDGRELMGPGVLNPNPLPEHPIDIRYPPYLYPTFSLPPPNLEDLRIVHGSCRKAHDAGFDALAILDSLIDTNKHALFTRPHQLFLTGDQIYAEEVKAPLLWLVTDAADSLLGWAETLPGMNAKPSELRAGLRANAMRLYSGLSAHSEDQISSHVLSVGEYYAMYLFAWSNVLWPDSLPASTDLIAFLKTSPTPPPPTPLLKAAGDDAFSKMLKANATLWRKDSDSLKDFKASIGKVRRALANIPTYMIFDDHDVTDDWFLNRWWAIQVLTEDLGRRLVQNALIAYSVFQAWGNTPERFEAGSGAGLLAATAMDRLGSADLGQETAARNEIDQYIGLPLHQVTGSGPGPEHTRPDGDEIVLDHDPQTLSWHYIVEGPRHEVIVLDTRTWRGFSPDDARRKDPPALLSPSAMQAQLAAALDRPDRSPDIQATLVIATTNPIGIRILDHIQAGAMGVDAFTATQNWEALRTAFDRNGTNLHATQIGAGALDVGDAWNFHAAAFARLLATLFRNRTRVVILTGDIHFGFAVRLTYWARRPFESATTTDSPTSHVFAQLTSSAFKNADAFGGAIVAALHSKAKYHEAIQSWAGWNDAPELMTLIPSPGSADAPSEWYRVSLPPDPPFKIELNGVWAISNLQYQPDWRYHIEFAKRELPPGSVPPPFVMPPVPAAGDSPEWLRSARYFGDVILATPWGLEGYEIVGLHNLGVVRFEWPDDDDRKVVIQDLYWWPRGAPTASAVSRYRVSLKTDSVPPGLPIQPLP